MNLQRGGLSTQSFQVTPELLFCRPIMSGKTEKKANIHNVTQPILNAQWFSERILYYQDVVQKLERGDYVEYTTQGLHSQ